MSHLGKHFANKGLTPVAPNPYLEFGLRLGRDELYALAVSIAATLTGGILISMFAPDMSSGVRAGILAVIGPLAEKPGLFFHYFKEAFREYRAAPVDRRKSRLYYISHAVRAGWPSLRADLLYHDPVYTVLLWYLIRVTGASSVAGATLLSGVSFTAAVAVASGLEVVYVDIMYRCLLKRLRRAGFVRKSYYESRFLVDPEGDPAFAPEQVFNRLQSRFELPVRTEVAYRDLYLTAHTLAVYNGRRPYLRFRQRLKPDGTVSKQAVQVMYTLARELRNAEPGLYRCFAVRKEKAGFDFALDQPMPWTVPDIPDARVRAFVQRFSDALPDREIRFRRTIAMNPGGVFISVDLPSTVPSPDGAYWIEVKTRENLDDLRDITEYIAWKLPVRATTKSKPDLILMPDIG